MNLYALSSTLRRQVRPHSRVLWTSDWVCKSCRTKRVPGLRFSSSTAEEEKPYYITTPIFYVNAAPHVGHLYTMVLTDILKRWQLLRGREAILCTGTDEHGMKIQQAAELAKMPEKEFCDKGADIFKALAKRADISNDHFVRTTDPDHAEAVKYFWNLLQQRGYIYESKHEGWYSVSDETFYPESAIEKRIDPLTGRIIMASQETGKEVEWTSEPNYHFRLSAMKDQLLEFYAENPEFVVPAARMKDVIKWVTEDLSDLSLSRPVSRLTWGIRVPNDDSQTIYVWLDALVNYITKAGYPGATFYNKGIWPADVHVIGKDIVRFHCIYWPAFLLAADLVPPKQVLTHAHWTLGKQKMSKSTGNVVNPFFALDKYGVDVMRFYLAHDGGISNDSDYGNHLINERYDKALKGGIGGLHGRLTRAKKWDLREVVRLVNEGALEGYESELMEEKKQMVKQRAVVRDLREKVTEAFDKLNPGAALQIIMAAIYQTNRYLQVTEPWLLPSLPPTTPPAPTPDNADSTFTPPALEDSHRSLLTSLYYSVEALRIVGILVQPYMPTKASELLDSLGVAKEKRSYEFAVLGADGSYGSDKEEGKVKKIKDKWGTLFPPLIGEV